MDRNTQLTIADAASDSLAVSYTYDNDGLLTGATVPADGSYMYLHRDSQNGLLDSTSIDNVSDVWSYNLFAEPTAYTATVYSAANGSVPIYSARYTRRDQLGRIVHKEETIGTVTHTADYSYDLAGRLLTITRDGSLAVTYAYDGNGNRLSATTPSGVITGTYDAQDRMTAYGDDTFAYNQSGQLTQRTNTQTNAITSYTYDTLGNLQHVNLPSGHSIDYVVDGLNRRIGKKIDGTLVQGFLYLNRLHPAAELDGSGHIISTFIYADRANVPSYMIKGTQAYRIIADQLGSPRLVVDASTGAIMQELDYDEWGNVVNDTNPGFQPFGFAGGIYDRDTGLVRFGARDYDPSTGRWTAKDPIAFNGEDSNIYEYVESNPVNYYDASGKVFLTIWASISKNPGVTITDATKLDNNYNAVELSGTAAAAAPILVTEMGSAVPPLVDLGGDICASKPVQKVVLGACLGVGLCSGDETPDQFADDVKRLQEIAVGIEAQLTDLYKVTAPGK